MKNIKRVLFSLAISGSLLFAGASAHAQVHITKYGKDLSDKERAQIKALAPNAPLPKDDEFVHIPPSIDTLEGSDLHPKMKEAVRRGHDLFVNTQQLYGKNVYNNMNCSSCHMGEGRLPFAGPIWPAAVVLPSFRPKNDHVNSLEERIAGCFTYSMNGKPPAYGSDDMLAISAYIQWLASGVPMYLKDKMYGRGYPRLADAAQKPDADRGQVAYKENCAVCHSDDGAGIKEGDHIVFPALWGDDSYNWGAGISRVFTLASFIKHNMPLGKPNSVSDQDAWDIAQYINSQERPQDPRYTGNIKETHKLYNETFYKHSMYGQKYKGKILGDHDNVGHKDFLKPDILRPRDFSGK